MLHYHSIILYFETIIYILYYYIILLVYFLVNIFYINYKHCFFINISGSYEKPLCKRGLGPQEACSPDICRFMIVFIPHLLMSAFTFLFVLILFQILQIHCFIELARTVVIKYWYTNVWPTVWNWQLGYVFHWRTHSDVTWLEYCL